MTIIEAMEQRHAVRRYEKKVLEESVIEELEMEVATCNEKYDLSIQLILNDPQVFKGFMPYFVGFRNASNYLALVGREDSDTEEFLGYCGQHLALKAQQLGLNTAWVGATFRKEKCKAFVKPNEALICVIAIGYGQTQGEPHQSKPLTELCHVNREMPDWFCKGMEAVMLAPTANNKQDILVTLKNEKVIITTEEGPFKQVNTGIVKYHFEKGAEMVL
ncbi:nitroreductase family protein [Enterococcus sp. DIV0187]|uniref:nitroreductase family protein n=1 Tax=Enterococcus sp. DIV0187 TaxID=2774644 RepID=UPI003F2479D7